MIRERDPVVLLAAVELGVVDLLTETSEFECNLAGRETWHAEMPFAPALVACYSDDLDRRRAA